MKQLLTFVMLAIVSGFAPVQAGLREPAAKENEFTLGRLAMGNKFYPAAVEAYREIVARYPRDPRAWAEFGRALAAQGDRERAMAAAAQAAKLYRERVQIFPEDGAACVELVRALLATGRYDEAQAALDEGLQRNPVNAILLAEKKIQAARTASRSASSAAAPVSRVYTPGGDLKLQLAGKSRQEVQEVLEAYGITFSAAASVYYLESRNQLILRHTREGHATMDSLLSEEPR